MIEMAVSAFLELSAVLLPPANERDRRWWKLGIVLGGAFFVVGCGLIVIWNLRGNQ